MRHIPQGLAEYERLPTVFLNWNEMSTKLRGDEFSGYIEVEESDSCGFILFIKGKISGSLFVSDHEGDLRGQPALSKTTQSIHSKKGNLSIYACDDDVCDLILWYIQGKRLYTPMESSFIDWGKFLSVMKDRSVDGFIRVAGPDYTEFIKLDGGDAKGHFIGRNKGFEDKSPNLSSILEGKDTLIEVLEKSDTPVETKPLQDKSHKPESKRVALDHKPVSEPAPKPVEKEPLPTPVDTVDEPEVKPPVEKKPLIPPDEIPDPFASHGDAKQVPLSEIDLSQFKSAKPDTKPAQKSEPKPAPSTFSIPERKADKPVEPPADKPAGKTMVAKPSGRVAFLIDGIRKVAQSNIGDDILPWLDGQISRIQSVNPKLTKHDLTLLVDEVERYVRQVRQNPSKAEKLANQLRHIIDSFASDL